MTKKQEITLKIEQAITEIKNTRRISKKRFSSICDKYGVKEDFIKKIIGKY